MPGREEALDRARGYFAVPGLRSMAERVQGAVKSVSSKVDDVFTNYLRNTTTDQEILDFYGEGNVIGRKGIPADREQYIDDIHRRVRQGNYNVRPVVEQDSGSFGLLGKVNIEKRISDIPEANDPSSGRPWQMEFAKMNFPKNGGLTIAADRFLEDFRVPRGNTKDYSFRVSPNVEDVKEKEREKVFDRTSNYEDGRKAFLAKEAGKPYSDFGELNRWGKEELETINNRDFGGLPIDGLSGGAHAVPADWKERHGFEPPSNLTRSVLDHFRNEIMSSEKSFGSVSQLTPITEHPDKVRPGGDPDWRANLYERAGIAGPLTEVTMKTAYDNMSDNVQQFVKGNKRLLPLQPSSEFFTGAGLFEPSKASAIGTEPAPGFTRLQEAVGTRNYLIGRNILDGRGSFGAPVRVIRENARGAAVGAAFSALNPEVAQRVKRDDYRGAAGVVARDTLLGAGMEAAITAALRAAPAAVSRVAAPVTRFAGPVAAGAALFGQGQTGSLTDVLVNKAANVVPGLRPNPRTDLGRQAGNEAAYMWRELSSGRMPYGSQSAAQTPTRRPGTTASLGGRPVVWGGDTYGWQTPASAKKLGL